MIDNDRMWASVLKRIKDGVVINDQLPSVDETTIIGALKDQGPRYDTSTEKIEKELRILKGLWYMCIKDEPVNHYTKGKLYKSPSDDTLLNDLGESDLVWESTSDSDSLDPKDYFRLATEEDIMRMLDHVNVRERMTVKEPLARQKTSGKFQIGDFITDNHSVYRIENVDHEDYKYRDINTGELFTHFMGQVELLNHLWTILDAKDGDVIYYTCHGSEEYCIVKGIAVKQDQNEERVTFHFCLSMPDGYMEAFDGTIPYSNITSMMAAKPATKEQCEFLFSKMKEAGYEWDTSTRALKKLADSGQETPDNPRKETTDELTDFETSLYDLVQQCQSENKLHDYDTLKRFIKKCSFVYLDKARKQIADEIHVDVFCANTGYVNGVGAICTGSQMNQAYRDGVNDVLNKIRKDRSMKHYTSIEQSKRLLELGLNPESADMHYSNMSIRGVMYSDPFRAGLSPYKDAFKYNKENIEFYLNGTNYKGIIAWEVLPCWSLSALLELMPTTIKGFEEHRPIIEKFHEDDYSCKYIDIDDKNNMVLVRRYGKMPINAAFEMVCWLLENGCIKKGE